VKKRYLVISITALNSEAHILNSEGHILNSEGHILNSEGHILKSTTWGMAILTGFSIVMSRIAGVLRVLCFALPTRPWLILFATIIPLTSWVFLTLWLTSGLCQVSCLFTTN